MIGKPEVERRDCRAFISRPARQSLHLVSCLPILEFNKIKEMNPEEVSQLIRNRRSIFPDVYTGETIDEEIVKEILENANWAPNHRKTEPWRFKVFSESALKKLGAWLADHYKNNTPPESFKPKKVEKTLKKAEKSSHVIAICMQRDPAESLPEWEEIAAVSCAVQNMWLTCSAYGIGCYWSSPKSINDIGEFLGLNEGERCLGFFYMGVHNLPVALQSKRGPITEKTEWLK